MVPAIMVFAAVGAGLLLSGYFLTFWSGWIGWLAVGAVAGAIAARSTHVWIAWLSTAIFVPASVAVGVLPMAGRLLGLGVFVLTLQVALVLTIGFVVGGAAVPRRQTWTDARRSRLAGLRGRWAELAVVLAAVLVVVIFTAVVGLVGADVWLSGGVDQDCRTPSAAFGWAYEAINYDQADDPNLAPRQTANPNGGSTWSFPSQGNARAGDDVVTTDGVPIAGWYIPASSGIGHNGPTVVIVPGAKSNKSGMLKYATPLHDAYNLVLLDDRGMGRSGPGPFSLGLRESLDVEAMVDWLVRTKNPVWIGALGDSLGAQTALAAAIGDNRIRALVLDSMHAEAVAAAGNIMQTEWGLPPTPASLAIVAISSLRLGADVTASDPERTITEVGDRPVLFIHGTADVIDVPDQSAERNFQAALAAGVPVELEYCPGATHGMLVDNPACAPLWAHWVRSFIDFYAVGH